MGPVRILIVDDHELLREGMKELLASHPGVEVCGDATSEDEAMESVHSLSPGLVVIDVNLKQGDGISLVKRIKALPQSISMIVLSMFDEALYGERALRAGASGYVNKQLPAREVLHAIDQVIAGGFYFSPEIRASLDAPSHAGIQGLTDRELEVFRLIGSGLMTSEIAKQMDVSPRTVDTYRERLKTKLELKTARALNRRAIQWSILGE